MAALRATPAAGPVRVADGAVCHSASPQRATLEGLIRLKASGELLAMATGRVQAQTAGVHLSSFRGRGIEFDESRPYQPGDDLRTIDWRVTARTGKPHTKIFREERNCPVVVWLDLRAGMLFGTHAVFKGVRAAELAALVGWGTVHNGDRLGGLVFSNGGHEELRPQPGNHAALRLCRLAASDIFWAPPDTGSGAGSAEHSLLRLIRVARPGGRVFLVSDFRGLGSEAERCVRELASRGEVFLLHVFDPVEAELPPPGRYQIESGEKSWVMDTTDPRERAAHRERFMTHQSRLKAMARLRGVHLIECATTDDPCAVLAGQFRRR